MALDLALKIVSAHTVVTSGAGPATSTVFDFSTLISGISYGGGDKAPFPEGATFFVNVSNADGIESGALPARFDFQISIDGTNFRNVCSVTYTNAGSSPNRSARFGPIDWVPDAAVIASTDRATAPDLKCRVVITYTTGGTQFIYDAYIAGPQNVGPFNE